MWCKVEMYSSSRLRNAAYSGVSSSSHLAVADKGNASCQTCFTKGKPDYMNGLSVVFSPR